MKSITFQALTSCVLFAMTMQAHAQSEATNSKQGEERNVMLNAADANKPREIQIGLPSEDVNVYENGRPSFKKICKALSTVPICWRVMVAIICAV